MHSPALGDNPKHVTEVTTEGVCGRGCTSMRGDRARVPVVRIARALSNVAIGKGRVRPWSHRTSA